MALRIGVDARELQGRPTGTGRYLRSLLQVWSRSGDDAWVLYFSGPPPADPVLAGSSFTLRTLGGAGVRGLAWQERLVPRAAAGDRLDVFFAPAYVCPLRLRVPRVTAVHDLSFFALPDEFRLLDGIKRRILVRLSMQSSARILACSDFTRREIAGRFPELAGRVEHVALGPDAELPDAPSRVDARRRLGVEGPLLLTVGSIFNRRRLPELLRALAALATRIPGVRLDVVGENRTQPTLDLERLARSLRVANRVRFCGFLGEAELALRYAAADAAVFLSDYEGFGLPALEAMGRGVPVLVSDRPSLSEVAGPAALVVDARDVAGVAGALERVLRDQALREDLVRRGRALAGRYSWTETAGRTRRILAEAAAGGGGRP